MQQTPLWLSILAMVVTAGLLYVWWWVPIDGPWAPPDNPRYVQMYELMPILGATVALYGVQPRMDWIDLQSPRPLAGFNTAAAGVVIATFAFLPLAIPWLWRVSDFYAIFLPEGMGLTEEGQLPTYGFFLAFACNIIIVLGLACLTTSLAGRSIGPLGSIMWFAMLLVIQGHLGWRGLATVAINHILPEPSLLRAAIAATTFTVDLYAYHRSAAGTRKVI